MGLPPILNQYQIKPKQVELSRQQLAHSLSRKTLYSEENQELRVLNWICREAEFCKESAGCEGWRPGLWTQSHLFGDICLLLRCQTLLWLREVVSNKKCNANNTWHHRWASISCPVTGQYTDGNELKSLGSNLLPLRCHVPKVFGCCGIMCKFILLCFSDIRWAGCPGFIFSEKRWAEQPFAFFKSCI